MDPTPKITLIVERCDGVIRVCDLPKEAMASLTPAGWAELAQTRLIDLLKQCGYQPVASEPGNPPAVAPLSLSIMPKANQRGGRVQFSYLIFGHTGSVPSEMGLTRAEVVAYVEDVLAGRRSWPQ